MFNLPDFQEIESIHQGKRSLIYRALRRSDRLPVILKINPAEFPGKNEIDRMNQEYEIGSLFLRDTEENVIRYYALQNYRNSPVIVLEDFGAVGLHTTLQEISRERTPLRFLKIAIQLAEGLGTIHSKNIIHKDVKPSNIVIHPETGLVKYIDFGLASQAEHETRMVFTPDELEGGLSYISPEQTGRMNRTLDYRTDYYSLGVTFYELLTGRLPFDSEDVLELIHCHIALNPPHPHKVNSLIPSAISRIVLKLLEKNAEERYQSSDGLKKDLERCLQEFGRRGVIDEFSPGEFDYSEKFRIPEKLYGRRREVNLLLEAWDNIAGSAGAEPAPEILLIRGYQGCGKTTLAEDMQNYINARRGYFISGSFSLSNKDIYGGISQAFRNLIRIIMTESEERIAIWKEKVKEALGDSGGLICDIIPEVGLLLGERPEISISPAAETRNLMALVFRKFTLAFCEKDRPLTIFLDDLQGADDASLTLLESLLYRGYGGESRHLLVLGAYRENEVDQEHPLSRFLTRLRAKKSHLGIIQLQNLQPSHISELICDTLKTSPSEVFQLVGALFQKTEGNPFFIKELLKNLHKEDILRFDAINHKWTWDIERVFTMEVSDNVIDVLLKSLSGLPEPATATLKAASFLEEPFTLNELTGLSQLPPRVTIRALRGALFEGILQEYQAAGKNSEKSYYRFQHKQIRQAAYAMSGTISSKTLHGKRAALLLKQYDRVEDIPEDKIPGLVYHLNRGAPPEEDTDSERDLLIRLNLRAAAVATKAAVYQTAREYVEFAAVLSEKIAWEDGYAQKIEVLRSRAGCAFLCGDLERAEKLFEELLRRTRGILESAEVHRSRMLLYHTMGRQPESIQAGLEALAILGVKLPAQPGYAELILKSAGVNFKLRGKTALQIIKTPEPDDETKKAAMNILSEMLTSSFVLGNSNLTGIIVVTQLNISLQYGLTPGSAYAFLNYSIFFFLINQIDRALFYSDLAMAIRKRFPTPELKSRFYFSWALYHVFWKKHWDEITPTLIRSIKSGIKSGDLLFAAYSATYVGFFDQTTDLTDAIKRNDEYVNIIGSSNSPEARVIPAIVRNYQLNLAGKLNDSPDISDADLDEKDFTTNKINKRPAIEQGVYHTLKLELCYFYEDYEEGLKHIQALKNCERFMIGFPLSVNLRAYRFLTHSALFPRANPLKRIGFRRQMIRDLKRMRVYAKANPANFLHIQKIMEAEWERVMNRPLEAAEIYDQAINEARKNNYPHWQALSNDLTSHFYHEQGRKKIAAHYIRDAHYLYNRRGFIARVRLLERRFNWLEYNNRNQLYFEVSGEDTSGPVQDNSTTSRTNELDLLTVTRASQTISREINLDRLLSRMIRIIIENAGAQKGFLILLEADRALIEAEAHIDSEDVEVLQSTPLAGSKKLSEKIVRYVIRTGEVTLLNNASEGEKFADDPYIQATAPRSVLCIPIGRQERVLGALYLENNLTTHAFTASHTGVLEILLSQASISLENARLYDDSRRAQADLQSYTRELESLAYSIAHDLRTPLRGIGGFSHALLEDKENVLNSRSRYYLERIKKAAIHMGALMDDLLKMSLVIRNRMKRERVNLSLLLRSAQTELIKKFPERKVELVLQEDLIVEGDTELLRIALENLLDNAWKFTSEAAQAKIEFGMEHSDSKEKVFYMRDNGVGFNMAYANKLFKSFEKLHDPEKFEGAGIGLAVVERVISRHGGKTWAKSEPDQGAVFYFTLGG